MPYLAMFKKVKEIPESAQTQNLMGSPLAHAPSFQQVWHKSFQYFWHNPAYK